MEERPQQDYIGKRDLTTWPSAAGQRMAAIAAGSTRWFRPRNLLGLTLVIGLLIVGVLTALAGKVYDAVIDAEGVAALDQPALDAAISSRTSIGNTVITAYTNVGGPVGMPVLATLVALGLALLWRQRTPIVLIAVTAVGSLLLTIVGKTVVGRTRPPLTDAVPPFEHSASFPSGHALNSAAIAGVVAYLLLRRQQQAGTRAFTVIAAVTFILTMGLSRVYLGHHWLTDVLVAWTVGFAWLVAVITAHRMFLTARRQRAP